MSNGGAVGGRRAEVGERRSDVDSGGGRHVLRNLRIMVDNPCFVEYDSH
jgi:hypothetical protein